MVLLLDEGLEILSQMPLCFDPSTHFFRHTRHSTAMGLRFNGAAAYEEICIITGHTTNKAFDRYLRLEGETVKGLLARRRDLTDNLLITSEGASYSSILEFRLIWSG